MQVEREIGKDACSKNVIRRVRLASGHAPVAALGDRAAESEDLPKPALILSIPQHEQFGSSSSGGLF